MARDLKAKVLLFQGALWLLFALPVWAVETTKTEAPKTNTNTTTVIEVYSPSHTIDDSKPLRFGDPETMMQEEEMEEEMESESTVEGEAQRPAQKVVEAKEKTSSVLHSPVVVKKAVEPVMSDPAKSVRAIIASVPKGNDFPAELERIVSIGEVGIPTLVTIYEDASSPWQSRWIAGMALGRLGTLEARLTLEKGLEDSLFLVRMASIQALSRQKDLAVAPQLRKALLDRALVVRSTAVESLERLRDHDSIPDLIKELGASHNFHRGRSLWIREQIVRALGSLGNPKAISPLLGVLRESEMGLRLSACSALARISPEAMPATTKSTDEACVAKWVAWGSARKESGSTKPANLLDADRSGDVTNQVDNSKPSDLSGESSGSTGN